MTFSSSRARQEAKAQSRFLTGAARTKNVSSVPARRIGVAWLIVGEFQHRRVVPAVAGSLGQNSIDQQNVVQHDGSANQGQAASGQSHARNSTDQSDQHED